MSHIVSNCQCLQYPDDTTIHTHSEIKNLKMKEQILEIELNKLLTWTTEANLVFSSTEKKLMVNTSKQMKRFSSFRVGKQLVESLVLTNLDYFNVLFINTLQYKKKMLQN